jgi:low affinity Fe/Cu permease
MMVLIWTVAVVISLAPLFGWKDANFEHRVNVDKICMVSQKHFLQNTSWSSESAALQFSFQLEIMRDAFQTQILVGLEAN